MRLHRAFPSLILASALALSGCLGIGGDEGEPSEEETPTDTGSPSPGDDGTTPRPTGGVSNETVPEAQMEANVTNGSAPLEVEFNLSAEGSKGTSGTELRWALEAIVEANASDNATGNATRNASGSATPIAEGTRLPATVNHTFEEAGNFTVTFTIFGETDSSSDNETITVTSAGGGAGVLTYELEGAFAAGTEESQILPFEVPAGAVRVIASLRWTDDDSGNTPFTSDLDLFLFDAGGDEVDASESGSHYEFLDVADDLADAEPGQWTAEALPFDVGSDTEFRLFVLVFLSEPERQSFEGTSTGQVLGSGIGHAINATGDVSFVFANLTWRSASPTGALTTCSQASRGTTDLDLYAFSGEDEIFRSADFGACEWGFAAAEEGESLGPAEELNIEVDQFLSGQSQYNLTVLWV